MYYRFRGTNGSMGLVTNNRYQITIETDPDGKVHATIFLTANSVNVGVQAYAGPSYDIPFMPYVYCPYSSLETFKENWEEAGRCTCTHPGQDDGSTTCWEHHDCTTGDCTHGE